ncbi:hypothetical protein TanjilG_22844 [Lupinus angustifolius]|uniref:HMA domain-containing protein n=2 Tax=Lupinus angustifolius TaxID=3871 RepID=A0A4P1RHT5_LUPAN|nr:hypothetical protein TanjilG_22844 [Lupinus angustifolius]
MDCEGCERRVKKSVEGMKGVTQVEVNPKQSKLTVIGFVEPNKVLERVRHRTGKKAEFWPYVPYDVVPYPYAPEAYCNVLQDPEVSTRAKHLLSQNSVSLIVTFRKIINY